ncbi:ATP-binding protein [Peptococcaceae bacterium 1198_IL3148]
MQLFSRRSLRFQVIVITLIILVIPALVILYDNHYAGKKEEITFMAKEERLGTIVQTVSQDLNAQMFANKKLMSQMNTKELHAYLGELFSEVATPKVEINPGVRLSLYIPESNELVVKGFLHNYRKLSADEQVEREKEIFKSSYAGIQSVIASGHPLATISGEPDDRFFQNFVPIRYNDEIVAVLWADERLHPIFDQARQFRTMSRSFSLLAIVIGGLGAFVVINNLTLNVRRIKKGLENLEKDINNLLPEMPGEMGQIVGAINKMACSLAEKERLEEEMRRQERLASLGQVVTGVAHELRNPLGIIKTTVQLMEGEVNEPSVQEYCHVIKNQVDRQNKVITELLAYGRPSKPLKELLQLNKLLDAVLTFTSAQLRQNKVKLKTIYDQNLPHVYADADRIKQVFVNLILNSVQAMPHGGRLVISTSYNLDQVMVKFKDSGIGIQEGDIKKVFEPFFTTKDTGTGLGLTICRQIVMMHKGDIKVENNEEGGVTFIVILPIVEQGVDN